MSTLLARVIDSWDGAGARGIVVDDGKQIRQLEWSTDLPLGAWIQGTLTGQGVLLDLRVLSVPAEWDASGDPTRWLRGRRELLWQRQSAQRAVRNWFQDHGFLEAETPLLVPGMAPDPHLDPITVDSEYLITSTEYQVKRLLVGGFQRVFTLTKNFRKGEIGQWHNPEFTMLEWGRAGATLHHIEDDAQTLIQAAFRASRPQATKLQYGESTVDLLGRDWERLTLHEAFEQHLGLTVPEDFNLDGILCELRRTGKLEESLLPRDPFEAVSWLVDQVQPYLGQQVPTFLRGWPAFLTPSAAVIPDQPHLADRSELFIAGVELGDGFGFACDAAQQRQRFEGALAARRSLLKSPVHVDQRFLDAIAQGLPPGAGMAIGFDRLVMLVTGASEIREVLSFAWDER